jgi:hypothetical protein
MLTSAYLGGFVVAVLGIAAGLAVIEPPVVAQSFDAAPRQVLGALLLAAGRPADAETEYRKDLQRFREHGWRDSPRRGCEPTSRCHRRASCVL